MLKTFAEGGLFGASYGESTPWVLALHGWARTHRDLDAVCAGFDAIALDLPGFGAAPAPPEAWGTARYAAHLAAVLDEMASEVVVVGHSYGGRVATHLAAAHPDRVRAQVLTGVPLIRANPGRGRSPRALRLAKALRRVGVVGEDRVEQLRRRYGSADYRAASGVMREVLVRSVNESYEEPLAAYPGPVELVWGEDDDQAPVSVARAAAQHCARPNLVVVPGAGHFLPLDHPEVVVEAISRHRLGPVPRQHPGDAQ